MDGCCKSDAVTREKREGDTEGGGDRPRDGEEEDKKEQQEEQSGEGRSW